MNLLKGTKTYLVGSIQYKNGRGWREKMTTDLQEMGIVCYDPYKKPFIIDVDECEDAQSEILDLVSKKDFDEAARRMKLIRSYDLALVDKADFLICYIDPDVHTCGSYEELFWCNRLKRPIFLIVEGGKSKTPLWLLGTVPHKYIYDNFEDVVEMLRRIDSGEKTMDSGRWRLLKPQFR